MATLELGSAAKNGDLLTVVDCLAKGAFVDARAEVHKPIHIQSLLWKHEF
jgi:hypothetical protein